MPQLFYEDGSAIPEAAIPEAVARGQAFAKPGAPIAVRDRTTGQIGRIDPSELGNSNYLPLSDAEIDAERIHNERGTLGQQAITGAEGLARGATLGLSDVALTGALGNEYRKGALERREENAKTAGVSEFAGAALPLLATEGGSAAATAATEGSALARGAGAVARTVGAPIRALGSVGGAVERGVAGSLAPALGEPLLGRAATKAASMGVSGAVEGAVFGAGQTLSDSTLKGDPLTTEALLAGMGQGALFGGVLGGGLGAASELAPAALGKLLPSKQKLEEASVGFARKQLGRDFEKVGKDMPREVAEGWKDASAKTLLERKLVGGENAGKTVFEASTKPQDIADNIGQMRRDIGAEIGQVREKAAAVMDAQPAIAPNVDELLAKGDELVKSLRKKNTAGANSAARAAEHDLKLLRKQIGEASAAVEPAIDVNVASDRFKTGMRPESTKYLKSNPDQANRLGPPRIEVYPDTGPTVADGRHRMALAFENGEKSIKANVVHYDGEGNVLSEGLRDVNLSAVPGAPVASIAPIVNEAEKAKMIREYAEKGLDAEFRMVPVSDIQTRPVGMHLDGEGAAELTAGLRKGAPMRPVELVPDRPGKFEIEDGAHRVGAAVAEGFTHVPAMVPREVAHLYPEIAAAPSSTTYRAVTEWQRNLEHDLNPKGVPKAMRGLLIKNAEARQEVSNIVNDFLKESTAKALTAAGEDGSIVAQLHRDYAGALSMQKAAEKEAGRVASNRRISLTDHMLGIGSALLAMSGGNMGALATMGFGAAASIGNKIAREQGNAIMAQIARRAARMDSLVEGAAHALSGTGEKLVVPVKGIIEAEKPAPYNPRSQTELKLQFAEVRDRLQELQSPQHQQAQLSHATGRLQTAYPEVANALNLHLLQAQSYLNSQLPQPRGGSPISPLARAATVPPREMQRFLSKANAVMAPEAVIADIAKGKLDDDAIGTLKEVYPETFGALRSATIRYTAANKEEMPYQRVVHISRLFGFPGDSSMGARFGEIQLAIQGMDKPLQNNTQQGAPSMPRLKGPTMKPGEDMTLPSAHAPGSR